MARSPFLFWAGEWDTWLISLSLSILNNYPFGFFFKEFFLREKN